MNRSRGADPVRVTLALAALGWARCGDAGLPRTTLVTDSAGVEIVTHLPGALEAAAPWSLSPQPVVEIGGGADPDVPLHQVTAVAPFAGGGVAVGTASPARALVFGPDGALQATLGREGGGPGEFQRVASVVPFGPDSSAVWDPNRRRISVFDREGAFVRDLDLSGVAPCGDHGSPRHANARGVDAPEARPGGRVRPVLGGGVRPGAGRAAAGGAVVPAVGGG